VVVLTVYRGFGACGHKRPSTEWAAMVELSRPDPDYLARIGAAKHRIVADYRLSPAAVDALAALLSACGMKVIAAEMPSLKDRMALCGILARTATAVQQQQATPDQEAALQNAVQALTSRH
jgi:hypothetical protein